MSDTVIKVDQLSKSYILAHQATQGVGRYERFGDALMQAAKAPFRRLSKGVQSTPEREVFWALRDVSFEVKRGEVVGIIGRNGAGKSTLLKILSRITEPTSGRVEIDGRVASLLEVGTGFHAELTGRENIYLNGAILGMSRAEIRKKFDEIVAFAEVEKFLDTAVKRYSSGMYVRLAFAVAAHLEPDILIVDEVLAVGDAQFQKKCLGKMQDVSTKEGRTVLFVSHNMGAVRRLCPRSIMLQKGRLFASGPTSAIVERYTQDSSERADELSLEDLKERSGSGTIRLTHIYVEDLLGHRVDQVQNGTDFNIVLAFKCRPGEVVHNVDIGISFHLQDETMLSVLYSSYTGEKFKAVPPQGEFRCRVSRLPLSPGRYFLGARIMADNMEADWPRSMVGRLDVIEGDFYGTGARGFEGTAPVMISGVWSVK